MEGCAQQCHLLRTVASKVLSLGTEAGTKGIYCSPRVRMPGVLFIKCVSYVQTTCGRQPASPAVAGRFCLAVERNTMGSVK